jgi:hypothetical protein
MSAWLTSKAHIDLLVQALCESELIIGDPTEIGLTLWRENNRSVNYRYGEARRLPQRYTYLRPTAKVAPTGVLYAVRCYQYQSCERPEWERTKAYRWTQALTKALLEAGADESITFGVYPWGFEAQHVHRGGEGFDARR